MAVILVPVLLRDLCDGRARVDVPGRTLGQVMRALAQRHPALAERLVEDGAIRPGLSLAINGDVVSTGLVTPVPDGAEIAIVPQISGG